MTVDAGVVVVAGREPDPALLQGDRGRVMVSSGTSYAPGTTGQVRLNIATSPDRLTEIVERLAKAWT